MINSIFNTIVCLTVISWMNRLINKSCIDYSSYEKYYLVKCIKYELWGYS